jgi:hypothetical protein
MLLIQVIWLGVCWLAIAVGFGRATRRLVAHGG